MTQIPAGRSFECFTVAPAAEVFIRRMLRFSGQGAGAGFRMTLSPGGCSGLSAQFTVEAAPAAGDRTFSSEGLVLFIPEPSLRLLEGVTIDFKDTIAESGFKFINPTAGSCACSSSDAQKVQRIVLEH